MRYTFLLIAAIWMTSASAQISEVQPSVTFGANAYDLERTIDSANEHELFEPRGGIEEELIIEVIVFPNPTNGPINVEASQLVQTVRLLNSNGSVVETWTDIGSANFTLDISQNASGNYFLVLDFGFTSTVHPLLKRSSKL